MNRTAKKNAGRLCLQYCVGGLLVSACLATGLARAIHPRPESQQSRPAKAAREATPVMDEEYGAAIRRFTTEPYFLTELVDHLPKTAGVPTPKDVLGYVIGTPDKLTYTKDIYRYLRALEKSSPRIKTFDIGRSEEGRETLLVAVSDESNIARLERYKEITARLADPRKLTEEESAKLIDEGKAFYWASGSIHSPETGSPEMLMELAYRLAVEDTPMIREIRKQVVVLITPVTEVDGRDKQVDLYNYRKASPGKATPNLLYWGKYVAHDNNRDGLTLSLALSRIMTRTFFEWHPQILHDLHESVPFLYTSTGTGPYNAWLDPIVIDEWHILAYHEVEEMTRRGVPGVWTHGFYDGWAPNYMFYVANGHNAIGRFYETFGGRGADTGDRTVGAQSSRDWFRPNPPLSKVKWSIRNNINLQQSAILVAMEFVARNRQQFLRNFYLKSKRAVAKASMEGPAAYVIPGGSSRPVAAAELVNLLRLQGVEVHRAEAEFEVKVAEPPRRGTDPTGAEAEAESPPRGRPDGPGTPGPTSPAAAPTHKFPKGSYIVRMDQPYSRMADMMLDTQYYSVSDPAPYDDTGWTMGPLRNVETHRVTDIDVLRAPMTLLSADVRVPGQITGSNAPKVFLINQNTETVLMTLRYKLADIRMSASEKAFKAGGHDFKPGTFLIESAGNPPDLRARLAQVSDELGIPVFGVEEVPQVPRHELGVPRIAILHTWTNTQNEGWFRMAFDGLKIPYSYISDHTVRDTPNLKDRFDVIIFGPVGGSAQSIVRGLPMRGDPIPWKASELTPNLGASPDTTEDIRGGMGLEGVIHLRKFIESGGVLMTIGSNSAVPIDFGLTDAVSIQPPQQLKARGGIYHAVAADPRSPILYGYDDRLAVYFNQSPLFQVNTTGGMGGNLGGQSGASRPSGRGSATDPDVVQARKYVAPEPPPQRRPGEEPPVPEEVREMLGPLLPSVSERPRVVLRFAPERDLWVSGMLAGASELANRPAVLDVPVGKGHIVMFAINPIWRQSTQGSFWLVFNAALHFDHLSAGRATPPATGAPEVTGEEDEGAPL